MRRTTAFIGACIILGTWVAQVDAQRAPVARPSPELNDAIRALTEEFNRGRQDLSLLRLAPDYFTDHPLSDTEPAQIIGALNQRIRGDDHLQAYVKWQLAGALPESVDETLHAQLMQVYRSAPLPRPRPGLDPREKQQMTNAVARINEQQMLQINSQMEQLVSNWEFEVVSFRGLRDALIERLPNSGPVFQAALRDYHERRQRGVDARSFIDRLRQRMDTWAADPETDPRELRTVADLLTAVVSEATPAFFTHARVADGKISWATGQPGGIHPTHAEELAQRMRTNARR